VINEIDQEGNIVLQRLLTFHEVPKRLDGFLSVGHSLTYLIQESSCSVFQNQRDDVLLILGNLISFKLSGSLKLSERPVCEINAEEASDRLHVAVLEFSPSGG
jgi:hypothetical protein